jgi:phosphohistidine swiveling domain-containing protein
MKNHQQFKSPALKGLNSTDWHFFGLWKQLTFSAVFWVSCFNEKTISQLGLKAKNLGAMVLLDGNFLVKKSELANIDEQISEKILSDDEEFFKKMVKVANDIYASAVAYSKVVGSQEPTAENFHKFLEVARSVNFLWLLGAEQFTITAEEKLQTAVVEAKFPAEKVAGIIPKVITPLYYQHHEVLELKAKVGTKSLDEVKKDTALWKKFQSHVEQYAWIEVANFMGESLTVERLYQQITHAKDETETNGANRDNEIAIPETVALRARIMSHCGYIKQAGAEHFAILSERALPFLNKIANKCGISYREFLLLTHHEVAQALEARLDTSALKNIVSRRQPTMKTALMTGPDNDAILIEDVDDVHALQDTMLPKAGVQNGTITGNIGNPGKYTGPVSVVMNTDDFPKLKPGDVLVTTMTTPDFVILMQKAGAIVTDIGGMLCHAAIVSREINKPCIIGTKFGSKILKDGDTVEVDADKGIVRLIS